MHKKFMCINQQFLLGLQDDYHKCMQNHYIFMQSATCAYFWCVFSLIKAKCQGQAIHMLQLTWPSLVQIKVRHLLCLAPAHQLNQCWFVTNWAFEKTIFVKFKKETHISLLWRKWMWKSILHHGGHFIFASVYNVAVAVSLHSLPHAICSCISTSHR